MKTLLIGLIALGSVSAFAQVPSARDILESMKIISKAHTQSQGVQEIKKEIENKYGVSCEGKTKLIPMNKIAIFKSNCTGGRQPLELTVKSSFELNDRENPNFKVTEYKVSL